MRILETRPRGPGQPPPLAGVSGLLRAPPPPGPLSLPHGAEEKDQLETRMTKVSPGQEALTEHAAGPDRTWEPAPVAAWTGGGSCPPSRWGWRWRDSARMELTWPTGCSAGLEREASASH